MKLVLAVDDRRLKNILHMPLALSLRDLRETIIMRFNQQHQGPPLPPEVSIPSEEWIRMNFSPSNPYINSANQYTGRFKVNYKVQTRLIRKSSVDEHYCRTIWK